MKVWSSIVTVCLSNLFTFHRNGVNNFLRWQIMFSVEMLSFFGNFYRILNFIPRGKILSYHYFSIFGELQWYLILLYIWYVGYSTQTCYSLFNFYFQGTSSLTTVCTLCLHLTVCVAQHAWYRNVNLLQKETQSFEINVHNIASLFRLDS